MNEPMNKSISFFTFCFFSSQANHWISVILILCLMSFGCSDDPEIDTAVVEKRQMDGWAAYDKGDFSAALLHFERVIELDATLADAHNGLGWTHLSTSHAPAATPEILAKAQRAFEAAIRSDTSSADAWIGLANTLFLRRENASDFQIALRAIDNASQGTSEPFFDMIINQPQISTRSELPATTISVKGILLDRLLRARSKLNHQTRLHYHFNTC